MEHEKLNIGKDELFESIKNEFAKQTKLRTIVFCIFCLLLGIYFCTLIIGAIQNAGIKEQVFFAVMFPLCIILGVIYKNRNSKMANADSAQELLAVYDKHKKIDKWMVAYDVVLLLAIIITVIFNGINTSNGISFMLVFMLVIPTIFVLSLKQTSKIEQLRELVKETNQN